MKKIFLAVAAAAMVCATSCSDKKAEAKGDYTQEEAALGDSLCITFGQMQAAQAYSNYKRMEGYMSEQQKASFKKEEFMKGLELVLTTDTANLAYLNGIQQGLQMYGIFMDKNLGVPVDARTIIKAFNEVYMADSVDSFVYSAKFQEVMGKVSEIAEAKEEARIKESPEAKENLAAGQKFLADKVAEGYQKSESGIAYKITNPGTGDKAKATDMVTVSYKGTHTNGEVFDQSNSEEGTRMSVAGVVPGFSEALQMLGKGGSMTVVIPADLAYGVRGQGPIGPQETLVFEITLNDITSPAKPAN